MIKRRLKTYFPEILLLIIISIFGLPSLLVDWMIVDDGVNVLISQSLISSIFKFDLNGIGNIFLEKEAGRFRPAYWLFNLFTYLFAGTNPMLHHFVRFIVSLLTVFIIYIIVKKITLSKTVAWLAGFIFIFTSFNIENWYRLGPVEPLITLYLSVSLYFIVKILIDIKSVIISKKLLLFSFFPIVLAYFSRETFVAIIPFSLFLVFGLIILKKTDRSKWLKFVYELNILNIILILLTFPLIMKVVSPGTYSSNYNLFSGETLSTVYWYLVSLIGKAIFPFTFLFLFSFTFYLFKRNKKIEIDRFLELSFIIGFISYILIQSPWNIPMGRYIEPALLFLVLAFGVEIKKIFIPLTRIKVVLMVICCLMFFTINAVSIINYVRDTIVGQKNIAIALKYIAKVAPDKSEIFWNLKKDDSTIELVYEGNLHLNYFYERPDLVIRYLDEKQVRYLPKGTLITTFVDSKNEILLSEKDLENIKYLKLIKTFPHEVIKYKLHPRSGIKSFLSKMTSNIRPDHDLIEKIEDKSDWKIYVVQ